MVAKQKPDNLLKGLNAEQRAAVTHAGSPLLIVAGAGTGKTTVITRRIAWLIQQGLAKPEEILALTFTDKAALEMEERVDLLLPTGYVDVTVSTFHAFAEHVLKDWALAIGLPNDFRILTPTEQWMLVRGHLDEFNLDYYRPLGNPTRFIHALLQHFSRAKDEEVYPSEYLKFAEGKALDTGAGEFLKKGSRKRAGTKAASPAAPDEGDLSAGAGAEAEGVRLIEVARAYHTYQKLMLDSGSLDFGDLINYTLKLFRERPRILQHFRGRYRYILVDEFQDTNYAQYELVKLLAAPANNVTVVGDDDQSIYKFRGASISNILEFKRDYPQAREIFLTENFRSYQKILDLAYDFIQLNNPYRLEVRLRAAPLPVVPPSTTREPKPRTEGSVRQIQSGASPEPFGAGVKLGQGKLTKKLTAARPGKGEVQYLEFGTGREEAAGVVAKIVELKTESGAQWRDFAILVRANAQAVPFLQALRQAQLPFDYVANRGLYQEAIVLDVVAYLKLLDNYHESEALFRVMSQPPFVMPAGDLASLAMFASRKTISLYEALQSASTIPLSPEGLTVGERLRRQLEAHTALARERTAAEVFVTMVQDLGIAQRVADASQAREASYLNAFYERLQRFEADTADTSLNSFLKFFTLELESGEEGQLPAATDEGPDTVKVITVHSAKGLEWRYVFLVQLVDRRFPSTERREPIELPRELIKEVLPEGDVHLQEERRLMYVGLTRARDGLFLTRASDYLGKTVRKPSRFLYELGFVKDKAAAKPLPTGRVAFAKVAAPASGVRRFRVPETFSFSSVSAFRKCPLEYKYRYLLRLPTPGAAALSYGITMHRTFEQFLRLWQARQGAQQGGLFGDTKAGTLVLPTEAELNALFNQSWVDDWYFSKKQKEEYRRQRAPKQLKAFYQVFAAEPPSPKYLEKTFKIGLGPYKFTGKIDRVDGAAKGVRILDYKTGGSPSGGLEKVDRDQLIIYQIAAEEFLHEHVLDARYWYLEPNAFSEAFRATPEQAKSLREDYTAIIDEIVHTIETDSFASADEAARKHECKYRHLG